MRRLRHRLRSAAFGVVFASHLAVAQLAMAQYPPMGQLTIPAAASAHGFGGILWRTDLWITSLSDKRLVLHVYFDCRSGCADDRFFTHQVVLAPHESRLIEDVLGTAFQLPGTSGVLRIAESCWHCPPPEPFFATSRTYTAGDGGHGTYGTAVPAFSAAQYTARATFPGVASSGGDKSSGFRTNAGFAPAYIGAYAATFTLKDVTGRVLGTPLTLQGGGRMQPMQIDDVFAAMGAGDVVTRDATLEVTSTMVGIPYVFVIDNVSGDSVFQQGVFVP